MPFESSIGGVVIWINEPAHICTHDFAQTNVTVAATPIAGTHVEASLQRLLLATRVYMDASILEV